MGLQAAAYRGGDPAGQEQEEGPVQKEPPEGPGEGQGHPAEGPVQHLSAGQDLQQWTSKGQLDSVKSHTNIWVNLAHLHLHLHFHFHFHFTPVVFSQREFLPPCKTTSVLRNHWNNFFFDTRLSDLTDCCGAHVTNRWSVCVCHVLLK